MNEGDEESLEAREREMAVLRPLAERFPNIDAAMAEIARLSAVLTLPKGTIHIISDIHGEDQKLRHVINNASGSLRPLVERVFAGRMEPAAFQEFLVWFRADIRKFLHSIGGPTGPTNLASATLPVDRFGGNPVPRNVPIGWGY